MQAVGFALIAILFLLCGALYGSLVDHTAAFQVIRRSAGMGEACNSACWGSVKARGELVALAMPQVLYYLASFFNQVTHAGRPF